MTAPALKADGFDDALLGAVYLPISGQRVLAYSVTHCIQILIERDGMGSEEAEEFFDFNTRCAYVGAGTPLWVDDCTIDDWENDDAT
mgnify:CR=1 FL=1